MTFSVSLEELNLQGFSIRVQHYLQTITDILEAAQSTSPEDPKAVQLCYYWAYEAKQVAILLRDAQLNLLKAEQYQKDGLRTDAQVHTYKTELQATIHGATYSLLDLHRRISDGAVPVVGDMSHVDNPVTTLLEQLKSITDQGKKIQRSQHKLFQLDNKFADYRNSHEEFMDQRIDRATWIENLLKELAASVSSEGEHLDKSKLSKLSYDIEHLITQLDNQKVFSSYEYIVVEDTDKLMLPVAAKDGQLIYKSIDILSEISGWNSFNMAAPLKAIDAKIHSYSEKVLAGLYQLLNRIKARIDSTSEGVVVEVDSILTPIKKLTDQYQTDVAPATVHKLGELAANMKKHIVPSQLFSENHLFLPSSALGQLAGFTEQTQLQRRYSLKGIKERTTRYSNMAFSRYVAKEQLTTTGYIDKILCFNPESDVNALFLRKGFLGSSFTIPRPEIEARIHQHFQLWQQGYGGSLLVSGGHGTGRSTVLELLPLLYPDVQSHHFVVGQKIDVNGHKLQITDDLKSAMLFVAKHTRETPCIVTIDDLDLFTDSPASTYCLYEDVAHIAAKHSKRIYFAVSIHKYLEQKLSIFFDLDAVWTEQISTDHMPTADIEEAVLTRAHAVANHEDVIAKSDELSRTAKKVSRRSNNNVGRAMQLWCMYYNGDYTGNAGNLKFKQTVLQHKELLLKLFQNGRIYEPYLRSMLNEMDAAELKADIQALTRSKLLVRPEVGYIAINPYLQSTIEAILN